MEATTQKESKFLIHRVRLYLSIVPGVADDGIQIEICEPVRSLAELWNVVEQPPKWTQRIVELAPRSPTVVQNLQNDCHVSKKDFVPKMRLDRNYTPRTLVCHDMMDGYLEDK